MPLNPKQLEAVHHKSGPLLILAGAGSGKTSTMAHRTAHLIKNCRVPAKNILALSFTNRAANELKERVDRIIGRKTDVTICTFHSLCVRILREHSEQVGYPKSFSILSDSDQIEVIRSILKRIRIDDRKFDPRMIKSSISNVKHQLIPENQVRDFLLEDASDYGIITAEVYEKYQESLRTQGSFDFDDLLFQTVRLLENDSTTREKLSRRYGHILVDEYQDTNTTQFQLLRYFTQTHQNLCVVGDDDQSIYAWRGADPSHILGFARQFPKAKTITLDQNYRSTSQILDAANAVIARNSKRHPKNLWSALGKGEPIQEIVVENNHEECETLADELTRIAKNDHRPWSDFAILFRSNTQARPIEEALRNLQVPYILVGGMSYLERKEIKDCLSYWRWITQPQDDQSARRVLNWPPRGLGKKTLETLHTESLTTGKTYLDAMLALNETGQLAPRAAKTVQSLHQMIHHEQERLKSCHSIEETKNWAVELCQKLQIKETLLAENSDQPAAAERKWNSVLRLAESISLMTLGKLKSKSSVDGADILSEFLQRLMLDSQEIEKDQEKVEKNAVTLMTLHSAKGLEFPVVFMVGMEENLLPHRRVLEEATDLSEERRLCYVGMTRAKEQLILFRAKNRIRYGKAHPSEPSRFLADIPQEFLISQDRSASPDLSNESAQAEHETKVKSFLDQIRSSLN